MADKRYLDKTLFEALQENGYDNVDGYSLRCFEDLDGGIFSADYYLREDGKVIPFHEGQWDDSGMARRLFKYCDWVDQGDPLVKCPECGSDDINTVAIRLLWKTEPDEALDILQCKTCKTCFARDSGEYRLKGEE